MRSDQEKLRIQLRAAEQARELLQPEFTIWLRELVESAQTAEQCSEKGLAGLAHKEGQRWLCQEIIKHAGRVEQLDARYNEEVGKHD